MASTSRITVITEQDGELPHVQQLNDLQGIIFVAVLKTGTVALGGHYGPQHLALAADLLAATCDEVGRTGRLPGT